MNIITKEVRLDLLNKYIETKIFDESLQIDKVVLLMSTETIADIASINITCCKTQTSTMFHSYKGIKISIADWLDEGEVLLYSAI